MLHEPPKFRLVVRTSAQLVSAYNVRKGVFYSPPASDIEPDVNIDVLVNGNRKQQPLSAFVVVGA
jgi:hypothetical protein